MDTMSKTNNTLKSKVYSAVFESIITGEYGTNDIISEKSLVEKFNVSKSPVRDALIELCNEGVLRSIPRYGYEVIRLTERDVEEIQKFRIIVECECLKQNFHNITDANIAELENFLEQCRHNSLKADAALKHWDNNRKFHLMIISFSNNKYIYESLKNSLNVLTRAYAQFYWDKWRKTEFVSKGDDHVQFVKSLKERNLEQALEYLKRDISCFE